MSLVDRALNQPVKYRGYRTTLERLGEIYTCSLPGGFSVMERPRYMNMHIYKHWYLAKQGSIFIIVHDQFLKVVIAPYLCLLSEKAGCRVDKLGLRLLTSKDPAGSPKMGPWNETSWL
jgi:hypothetical protein